MICKDRGIYYYELFDRSVNREKFIGFLSRLRGKFGKGRLALYQDNLRVHTSKEAMEACKDLDIEVQFGPVYSPEKNPIEMTFSILKNAVKRMRLGDMLNKRHRSFR